MRLRSRRAFLLVGLLAVVLAAGAVRVWGPSAITQIVGVDVDGGPGGEATLVVPAGYRASVFARGLVGPRFMAEAPDGTVYLAERGANRVVALPDRDRDGVADGVIEVGRGYEGAHSVAFDRDGRLWVAGETTLYRVELGPDGRETARIVRLEGLPAGGHSTRTVLPLPDGRLLLSVGSSCNVCAEEDPRRASVLVLDPERGEPAVFMAGLRNAVGLALDPTSSLPYATVMGRDMLGDELPPETLYRLIDGADAGWPRCHAGSLVDPEFGGSFDPAGRVRGCEGAERPVATFPAHWAPLGLAFWEGHAVVAFHGSWNRSRQDGYRVSWVRWADGGPVGELETLAGGFLPPGAENSLGRPAGLLARSDGSLLVSDDKAGLVYRIAPAR